MSEGTSIQTMRVPGVLKKFLASPTAEDARRIIGTSPVADADRTDTLVVNTSTNTAGVWSAAVTMTGVPAGAKAAWCMCSINKAGVFTKLRVEAASGYTLSDITSGTNYFKYFGIDADYSDGSQVQGPVKIHLDANGQFKWCTFSTNSTVQIGSAIDYEM